MSTSLLYRRRAENGVVSTVTSNSGLIANVVVEVPDDKSLSKNQLKILRSFVSDVFIDEVVPLCKEKIRFICSKQLKNMMSDWDELKKYNPAVIDKYGKYIDGALICLKDARNSGYDLQSLVYAVRFCYRIVENPKFSFDDLNRAWYGCVNRLEVGDGGDSDDNIGEEEDDDSADEIENETPPTLRGEFILSRVMVKLARYATAGESLFRAIMRTRRSNYTIRIATVEDEGYHLKRRLESDKIPSFDDYLLRVNAPILKSEEKDKISTKWKNAKNSAPEVYMHCEMKLFLFYENRPDITLLTNIFGISKKSCGACCEFLRCCLNPPSPGC